MESPSPGILKLQNPFVLRVGQVMTGFGMGCGLGIGVGVPIPMDIPGVAQVMSAAHGMTGHIGGGRQVQSLQGVAVMTSKLVSRGVGESQVEDAWEGQTGVDTSTSRRPSQPMFTPLSQHTRTQSSSPSDSEVELLRMQNEILRTLLRHQEKIEELGQENAAIWQELNIKGFTNSTGTHLQSAKIINLEHLNATCFHCRRRSRRRT